LDKILKKARGCDGTLELLENRIRIRRDIYVSLLLDGLRSDKEILLRTISSVQLRKADLSANGYLQFVLSPRERRGKGAYLAANDPNTITFTEAQQSEFDELRDMIESRIAGITESGASEETGRAP
jgi:hypothetical protein